MKKKLRLHVETLRILQDGPTSRVTPGAARDFLTDDRSICIDCVPGILTEQTCFR